MQAIKRFIRYGVQALLLLAAVAFAVSNRQTITLSLFPFDYEIVLPLFLLILGTFFAGWLLGGTSALFTKLDARKNSRHLQERIAALENEVAALNLPSSTASTTPPTPPALSPQDTP